MTPSTGTTLQVGAWRVDPAAHQISRNGQEIRLEARAMQLLVCLAARPGEIVSVERLLDEVWSGVVVTPDSVYQAVASLRRQLGDDAKQPVYIETVPRVGYRMIAAVAPQTRDQTRDQSGDKSIPPPSSRRASRIGPSQRRWLGVGGIVLALVAITFMLPRAFRAQETPSRSIAVLPFLDLTTQAMNEEYFADGMTEEVINRLSKLPDTRVASPTSSFALKGKPLTPQEIGATLGVAYVIDGSVRQSDATMRVAVRLVRADDGYVVWSQSYERSFSDKLKIQDDIATAVADSLGKPLE